MLATVHTYALVGVEATPVRVEVDLAAGAFPGLVLVGLPDTAVRESRERIVAALRNQGLRYPDRKITVNLAPAGLRKAGVSFDLPIAIALLVASGQAPPERLGELVWAGELSLEGRIRSIRGSLSMAVSERKRRRPRTLVLPRGNGAEAAAAQGVPVSEVGALREVVRLLLEGPAGFRVPAVPAGRQALPRPPALGADLADVRGQTAARRALEVAAAGGHNLLFIGSPGTGKSMLAERLPGIQPPMSQEEQLEATMVYSAAGLLPPGSGLLAQRPFRAPHHTVTRAGMIGGGSPPRPGEISLAHRGVLFLDELPEFRREVLEALRQPLESGAVAIVRASQSVRFPCRFQMIAAMNPCPCGRRLDPRGGCRCTPRMVANYLGRVSGPLIDRIDLHIEMATVRFRQISLTQPSEDSATVAGRAAAAWQRQQERFAGHPRVRLNAEMGLPEIREHCSLRRRSLGLLRMAMSRLNLSPRGYHRILRLSRTIADLGESDEIEEAHVAEAVSYRVLDREEVG
ncbi:MAG: YifB family Mg chelatase-like AAA ATPase [Candidatus Eisenbacteria sp.]|nr:YifB family Mg chelatase-like AAA ATPase [Candidatus Eisenbacteria bacterium]